jgi:hypothetical protein
VGIPQRLKNPELEAAPEVWVSPSLPTRRSLLRKRKGLGQLKSIMRWHMTLLTYCLLRTNERIVRDILYLSTPMQIIEISLKDASQQESHVI